MRWVINSIIFFLSMYNLSVVSQSTNNEIKYRMNERFVDDTEVYEFVNSDKNNEFKKSITMIIDNSSSMGDYTTENLPVNHWNNEKLYQLPLDSCDYCDNSQYTFSIENHYNDNSYTRRGFEGIHLLQPLFKSCSPEITECTADDSIQKYVQAVWPLVYPSLIFDGYMKLGRSQYSGICTVKAQIIQGRQFQIHESNVNSFNSNSEAIGESVYPYSIGNIHEVWIPVTDEKQCHDLNSQEHFNKNKKLILKYLVTQKGYSYTISIKSQIHQVDIILANLNKNQYINIKSCKNEMKNEFNVSRPFENLLKIIEKHNKNKESQNKKINSYNSQLNTLYTSLYDINARLHEYQVSNDYESVMDYQMSDKEILSLENQKKTIASKISDIHYNMGEVKSVNLQANLFNKTNQLYSRIYDMNSIENIDQLACNFSRLNSLGYMSIASFNFRNYISAKTRDKTAYYLASRYELVKDALKYVLEHYIEDNTEIRFVMYMMGINGSKQYGTQRVKVRANNYYSQKETIINLNAMNQDQYAHLGIDELMTFKKTEIVKQKKEIIYEDINEPTALKNSISKSYLYTNDQDKRVFAKDIIDDISTHYIGGGTPTSDALWVGYQLAKENLASSNQCYQANKVMLFTDGDANSVSKSLKKQIAKIHNNKNDLHKVLNQLCQQFDDRERHFIKNDDKSVLVKHQFDVNKPEDACSLLISEYMGRFHNSHPNNQHLNEKLPLYAIGFKGGLSKEGEKALHLISHANRHKPAIMVKSNEDLKQVFKQVLNFKTLNEEVTVSPVSPPTAGGGISRDDTAFFGLFKPQNTVFWDGNIKCYKVDYNAKDSTYRYKDRLGQRAFCKKANVPEGCLQSGQVNPSSFDYFNQSKQADGADVLSGGLLSKIHMPNSSNQHRKKSNSEKSDLDHQVADKKIETFYDFSKVKQEAIKINDLSNQSGFSQSLKRSWIRANEMINQRVSSEEWNKYNDDIKQKATYWLMGLMTDGQRSRKMLGDFLHSEFEVINYENHSLLIVPSNDGFIRAYKISKNGNLADVTNGLNTGEQVYSFIPQELFDQVWWRIGSHSLPVPNISKFYGFDGPMEVFHIDSNLNGIVDNNEKAYVIVGMRRGGNSYYLFDISTPFIKEEQKSTKNNAKRGIQLVRRISGVEVPLNRPLVPEIQAYIQNRNNLEKQENLGNNQWKKERKAYSVLGQTWSKPRLIKVVIANHDSLDKKAKPPLGCDKYYCYAWIFGGGYNPNNRDKIRKNTLYHNVFLKPEYKEDYIGNAVYLINAATGKLLWWASSEANIDPKETINNLQSVPSGITSIDVGGDNGSATDAAFFNDIEGNVFRINFNDFKAILNNKNSSKARWVKVTYPRKSVVSIGSLSDKSKPGHRRFAFYEPAVTFLKDHNNKDYFAVGFGTGYRPSPKHGYYQKTQNRIGVIFDYPVYSPKLEDSYFKFDCKKRESGSCLVNVTDYKHNNYLKPNNEIKKLINFDVKKSDVSVKPIGWYIDLDMGRNEKMISSGIAVKGYFALETFLPKNFGARQSETQCIADLGRKRLWLLNLSTGRALENSDRYFKSGRSLPSERLDLIKYQGEYLVTGTGRENSGQDLVPINVHMDSKQKLGIREAIPDGSVFYQEVSID